MLERGLVSRIIFPVPQATYTEESFAEDLVWIPKVRQAGTVSVDDTQRVPCLLLPSPSARFLIIYFHSNAEDLGRCRNFCHQLRHQFHVHVLAVEYPGYGLCPGTPSDVTVTENAFAAFYFVRDALRWPLDSIKVFGRSIGTGPAITLASQFELAGLVLVTPFISVRELFRDNVGSFATLVVNDDCFDNTNKVSKINCSTMVIHGQSDELVPYRHSEELWKRLTCRKLLISPPAMEHNKNLLSDMEIFILPMFHFFSIPDYIFENMTIPAWAYKRETPPTHSSKEVTPAPCGGDSTSWVSKLALTSRGWLEKQASSGSVLQADAKQPKSSLSKRPDNRCISRNDLIFPARVYSADGDEDSISDPDVPKETTKGTLFAEGAADTLLEQRRRGKCNGPKLEPAKVRQPFSDAASDGHEGTCQVGAQAHALPTLRPPIASVGGPRLVSATPLNPITAPRGDTVPPPMQNREGSTPQPTPTPTTPKETSLEDGDGCFVGSAQWTRCALSI